MRTVRRISLVVGVCACAIMLSGCMPVYSPAIGILLTDVYGPIDAGTRVGAKEGKACAQSILFLVAQGDASIDTNVGPLPAACDEPDIAFLIRIVMGPGPWIANGAVRIP